MKKIIFFFYFVSHVCCIFAQDYNIHGDDALRKEDFQDARTWFSEGLSKCDLYSIQKLTEIWKGQPGMQAKMRFPTMQRCFSCLKPMAESGNSNAMLLLSDYYRLGIGIEKDSVQANFWFKEHGIAMGFPNIDAKLNVADNDNTRNSPKKSLVSNRFYSFLAYTYSPTMPVGATIGAFDKFGFYLSYKTSYPSVEYKYTGNDAEVFGIGIEDPPYQFNREKWESSMISGGVFIPLVQSKLYLSVGGGFGKRKYFREIITEQSFETGTKSEWCYNSEASYDGVVLEAGGLFKWKRLIITGGVNSTTFNDFDMYLGLGFSF